jgi:hypothetical protein
MLVLLADCSTLAEVAALNVALTLVMSCVFVKSGSSKHTPHPTQAESVHALQCIVYRPDFAV